MSTSASGQPLLRLVAVMDRLRSECPWKREQTHRSLARYLLEETHEALEAIDTGDRDHLREELGDLLLQVYFHARIAEEHPDQPWSVDDVATDLVEKLVRRNPHVFGDPDDRPSHADPASVNDAWNAIKAVEKQREHLADGIPPTLPALLYADKLLDRLAAAGVTVETDPAAGDLGERLLALVAQARDAGVDPEQALRDTVRRHLPR